MHCFNYAYDNNLKNHEYLKKTNYKLYATEESPISNGNIENNNEVRNMTLLLGISTPMDSISYIYAEKFAEEVNTLSEGKIKIDIYTDSTLGSDRIMFRNLLQNENLHFVVQSTFSQVPFLPKLSVFDMPMIYFNIDDLRRVINNPKFYEKISSIYNEGGYKLLGIADGLFRQLTSNKDIKNADDFSATRIRTIQNPNHEAFWETLGAIVVPLPTSEVYPSLLHGLIDAQENSYDIIAALNLYKVQKYLINTNHLPNVLPLITSNEFYNSLSTAEKSIIDEAAVNATAYAREKADERFEEEKNILINNGMTIIDIPYETKLALREAAMPVYEKIREEIGDDELISLYFGN